MPWTRLVQLIVAVCAMAAPVVALIHTKTLMWTAKETSDGVVNAKGIPGEPRDWVENGFSQYAMSYFTDSYARNISHRVALAFEYNDRGLTFSDRGFKSIYRIQLQVAPSLPYTYYLPLYLVYVGISTQVNGMAMDWLSGSLYWTDALYNWITVADGKSLNVFNHIVVTGLLRPQGIAVYPQKGLLFWSDIGAVGKIEFSRLDGSNRANFLDVGLDKPLGLTIDYKNNRLYWVDDFRDTIEHVDIATGSNRVTIKLSSLGIDGAKQFGLFGLALYEDDYIFASDQNSLSILILNKTSEQYINRINAALFSNTSAIPYDILMYDNSSQELIDSDCRRLSCSDICISDGGRRAHCICRTGYVLNTTDNVTCFRGPGLAKPLYVYAMGSQLCSTSVHISDSSIDWAPSFVQCFHKLPAGHNAVGLSFHVYADFLFFSDDQDGAIHRMQLNMNGGNSSLLQVAANTGSVKGLAVDWIADNLYWTDEENGYIMVSRLSGRYPKILIKDLYRPKAINVDPLEGIMYWVSNDTIFSANMDGTGVRIFLRMENTQLDGMVLDITRDRLYFVDASLPGIRSVKQDGTELWLTLTAPNKTFQDVTVYKTYLAWTTGVNSIFFGISTDNNSTVSGHLRGILHLRENTSHDVITYDEYLQPQLAPGQINPCDIDNDGVGCQQLCLLVPNGPKRRCNCSIGFKLAADLRSCISVPILDNFMLFIDPFQKAMYQLDASVSNTAGPRQIHGIDLSTSVFPELLGYDVKSNYLFWHDNGPIKNGIKYKPLSNKNENENSLSAFSRDMNVGAMELLPTSHQLVFTDVVSKSLLTVDAVSPQSVPFKLSAASNVCWSCLAVEALSGVVYWVETQPSGSQSIYSCNAALCSRRLDARLRFTRPPSLDNTSIVGLTIGIGPGKASFLAFWTMNQVWKVSDKSSDGVDHVMLAQGNNSTNFTKVVVVDDVVYYTDWNSKSIFAINPLTRESYPITEPAFSRLTDLKVYRTGLVRKEAPSPSIKGNDDPLSSAALGGIIAAGIAILLILLLFIILIALLVRRRRQRRTPSSYKPPAHDNPTYMRHADLVAASPSPSPGAASPVDVCFAAGGETCGVTFAFDFDKYPIDEKKIPPSFDDDVIYDDDVKSPDVLPYCSGVSPISDEKCDMEFPPPNYSSFGSRKSLIKAFGSLPQYDISSQPSGLPL